MLGRLHLLVGSLALVALSACSGPDHGGDFDVPNGDATSDVRRDVPFDMARTDTLGMDVLRADVRPDVTVTADARDVRVTPDTGGRCIDSCTVDTDCQTTCPPTAGGSSNCCVFNVCTIVAQPACPGSMTGDAGTCRTSCGSSAECAGCTGTTCCFLGTCMAPPFGFCPDFGFGDGGDGSSTVDTGRVDTGAPDTGVTDTGVDTGPGDTGIDAPVSSDVPVSTDTATPSDAPVSTDAPTKDTGSASDAELDGATSAD